MLHIELNGTNAGAGSSGLVLDSSASTITGLIINRFGDSASSVNDAADGSTIAGQLDRPEQLRQRARPRACPRGVYVRANNANTVIGGAAAAARNVIAGIVGRRDQPRHDLTGSRSRTTTSARTAPASLVLGNGDDGIDINLATVNSLIVGNVISGQVGADSHGIRP